MHQNYRKLKRDFVVRNKDKKQAEKKIEDLQRKFDDIQLLKFGQVIDLDLLERSSGNKYVPIFRLVRMLIVTTNAKLHIFISHCYHRG